MNDFALLLLVGLPILSIIFGYFLWNNAMDDYGYNIYGIGVIIRLVITALVCLYDPATGLSLLVIVSIWNFIITYKNTSLLTAFFAVLFQPIAVWFAFVAINKLIKAIND